VVFYGIAAYEGFRFASRNIEEELTLAVAAGGVQPPPYSKYRFPLVATVFVALALVGFFVGRGSAGTITYNYESGSKRAEGEMIRGRENGYWQTWWENGKIQSKGFYVDGEPDSTWSFFNEEGVMTQQGPYRKNLREGEWSEFHANGNVASRGSYHHDRKTGMWIFYFETGQVSGKGDFLLDKPHGSYEAFFQNGRTNSKGSMKDGVFAGRWDFWTDEGIKIRESEFDEAGSEKIINSWTPKGIAVVVNGNGTVKENYLSGELMETGMIKDGMRTGRWQKFYVDGKKQEEGEFKNGMYYLVSAWTPEGQQTVTNGNGSLDYFYENGAVSSSGKFQGGLRTGQWVEYYPDDNKVMAETNYVQGKAAGPYNAYFPDGSSNLTGQFKDGQRDGQWTWYVQNGKIESVVSFVAGKKNGNQVFYNSVGKVIKTETYRNGEFIESTIDGE
jgi:antitoxin component YwqK of YwqJK toxin-antitoxin module